MIEAQGKRSGSTSSKLAEDSPSEYGRQSGGKSISHSRNQGSSTTAIPTIKSCCPVCSSITLP
eukprot:5980881-Pleurochrysis_carterae.AAC.2